MPPIFALVAAVISGILAAHFWQSSILLWWSILGLSILFFICKSLKSWPLFAAFLCLGALRYSVVENRLLQDPFGPLAGQKVFVRFQPAGESVSKSAGERFLAHVTCVYAQEKWLPVNTTLLAYSPNRFPEDSTITAEGDLGDLPPRLDFYRKQGCHHSFWISRISKVEEGRNQFERFGIKSRDRLQEWLQTSLLPPYNSIALGVVLGRHSDIPRDILDDFRVTGTYHVLVASGLKVALVAGAVWLFTWLCPFNFRLLASGLAVLSYAWLVGFEPPVLRAGLMAIFGLTAFLLGRGKDSLAAFFLVGLILLFAHPLWLFDVGFQLSFLSVLGILFFFEPISQKLKFLPKWMAQSIAVTLSAQFLILIPLAAYFHNVSFVSPLANLLAVPLTAVSMFLGSLSFGLSFFWKPLGFAVSYWHQIILALMVGIVKISSRLPGAYHFVTRPEILTTFFVYSFFLGLLFWGRKIGKMATVGGLAALIFLWLFPFIRPPLPRITFLDVGQGDCAILSFNRKNYLVDGGGSPSEMDRDGFSVGETIVVPALRERGINRLDGILLTHPHLDHVGGLVAVLKDFPVKEIWLPRLQAFSRVYRRFLKIAREKNIPFILVEGNEKTKVAGGNWVYFYWPVPPLLRGTVSDLNNDSVVSQWVIDGVRILLAGDVEIEGEGGLLQHLHPRSLLQSQILKVPHHGSGTSSTSDFLKAVSPEVAVVSVGERNLYHHPSPDTVRRLRRKIPFVFRTDQDGTVEFVLHSGDSPPWAERI